MAVVIRLKRFGRRHRPFYRIEAIERRNARGGRSLDNLGYYDPMVEDPESRVRIKLDRLKHWIEQGARPSQTVNSFLRKVDVKWGNTERKSRKTMSRKRRAAKKKAE